uniref:Uncharacterized protein n=1 Tax=Kalanchoe fedtschenkoi TaxID=63787 RepID=A0A7N0ZYI7_KALFE
MGPTVKENGVLKLVHPGGLVEIHTTPITAAEVMKMNPRHCVARPDVFKYPWIVVRPESVLRPGTLFYVVPHHTMRKLMLKAQEKELQQARQLIAQHSTENKSFNKGNREKSIFKHNGGNKQSRVACFDQSATDYASVDLSHFNSTPPSHSTDQSFGSQASGLSAFSEVMNSSEEAATGKKERNYQQAVTPNIVQRRDEGHGRRRAEMDPQKLQLTLERLVSVQRPTGNCTTLPMTENSNRMMSGLKSCLKTRETTNMSTTNLRVRFMLPGDEEKIMRTRSWLLEISPEAAP